VPTKKKTIEPASGPTDRPYIDMVPPAVTDSTDATVPALILDGHIHTIEIVTPQQAKVWLTENNTHNRRQRDKRVSGYARDMHEGAWLYLGDPIRFAAREEHDASDAPGTVGVLLDGQHRLEAGAKADVPFECLIIRGFGMAAQEFMDIGAARTLANVLGLRGESSTALLAAIMRRVSYWRSGSMPHGGSVNPTQAEMLAFLDANPKARDAVSVGLRSRVAGFNVSQAVIGAAWFLCQERSPEAAKIFFEQQLIEGLDVQEGTPAYLLARKFRLAGAPNGMPALSSDDAFWYLLWTWNHHRKGSGPMTRLQGPTGGWPAPKDFVIR
jgi:hypothetical protein